MPSGHMIGNLAIVLFFFFEFFHSETSKKNPFANNKLVYVLSLTFALGLNVIIGLNRIHLGVHSLDQVLVGAVFGLI